MKFEVQLASSTGTRNYTVDLERAGDLWRITLNGEPVDADVAEIAPNTLSILIRGESHEIRVARTSDGLLKIQTGLREFTAEVSDQRSWRGRRLGHVEVEGRQQITAPMAGKVVRVLVKSGEEVEMGQGLLVVEAMKMQNEIRSTKSGTVERLLAEEGQAINAGDTLVWIS
ncbi:MAG TPA: biotin/lipoyl-containing protein [Candidatus Acidoferrum sp.]|nr:biotin/lipoyl-containing protein [Candidatus Acidoferrum sp.]